MKSILLIRHAESVFPTVGETDEMSRPLSERGHAQAHQLEPLISSFQPEAIASSPYLRAIQTVAPACEALDLTMRILPRFREHIMAPRAIPNWRDVLAVQWSDFAFRPEGGETFAESAQRGWSVIQELQGWLEQRIALAGHGTTISLILNRLDPDFQFDQHLQMPNPAAYQLTWDGETWAWTWEGGGSLD